MLHIRTLAVLTCRTGKAYGRKHGKLIVRQLIIVILHEIFHCVLNGCYTTNIMKKLTPKL
jgi:hypothetical protein